MKKIGSQRGAIVREILPLALVMPYAVIIMAFLITGEDFSHLTNRVFIPWMYAVWSLSICGLLTAFFLDKKYPRLMGSILICLGVISIIMAYLAPPVESTENVLTIFICGPVYLLTTILGIFLLVKKKI